MPQSSRPKYPQSVISAASPPQATPVIPKTIDLEQLASGFDGITPRAGGSLAEACSVCMEIRGHTPGVQLKVSGTWDDMFNLKWIGATEQARRSWNDLPYAAEQGGYGLAILLMRELAGMGAIERSRKGTGFDYWLGDKDTQPFQNKARLEVTGTMSSTDSRVDYKAKKKLEQTNRSDGSLPAYVVVVEYGTPLSKVVKK